MNINEHDMTKQMIDAMRAKSVGGKRLIKEEDESFNPEASDDFDESLKSEIDKALSKLSDRERDIIVSYFGLNKELECMTLEAIGGKFGITKERVRQLKEKAIRKIRHNAHGIFDALNE